MQRGEQIYAYQNLNTSTKCWHLFHINCGKSMYYRNSGKGELMEKMSYFNKCLRNSKGEDILGLRIVTSLGTFS